MIKKQMTTTLKKLKQDILKDPVSGRFYRELAPQYELIKRIIRKRQSEGLTQKQLAQRLGTKQSAISRFESGQTNPTVDFLADLAEALGGQLEIKLK